MCFQNYVIKSFGIHVMFEVIMQTYFKHDGWIDGFLLNPEAILNKVDGV